MVGCLFRVYGGTPRRSGVCFVYAVIDSGRSKVRFSWRACCFLGCLRVSHGVCACMHPIVLNLCQLFGLIVSVQWGTYYKHVYLTHTAYMSSVRHGSLSR